MNTRKIKLALTAGLINQKASNNALPTIKKLMTSFKGEVGAFLGLINVSNSILNRNSIQEKYALQYENCTVNVELVSNPLAKRQMIQRFQIK